MTIRSYVLLIFLVGQLADSYAQSGFMVRATSPITTGGTKGIFSGNVDYLQTISKKRAGMIALGGSYTLLNGPKHESMTGYEIMGGYVLSIPFSAKGNALLYIKAGWSQLQNKFFNQARKVGEFGIDFTRYAKKIHLCFAYGRYLHDVFRYPDNPGFEIKANFGYFKVGIGYRLWFNHG